MKKHLYILSFILFSLNTANVQAETPLSKTKAPVVKVIKNVPVNLIRIPLTRQATDYTCGVASLQSVMMYFGDEFREDVLAKALKSDPNDGTPYHNMVSYAKSKGYSVNILKNMTLANLKKQIDQKKPVIVLLQAWTDKPGNYTKDWEDGHYAVVIGYDAQRIYFMDPSTLGNYTFIPTEQFLKRWHDVDIKDKLEHFGMIIEKNKSKYNTNDILLME